MTLSQTNSASETAVGQEQAYLDMLYRLLDAARDSTGRALAQTHGSGAAGGTFQARIEREVTAGEQGRRLAQLNAVEHGLCFGRTDADPENPENRRRTPKPTPRPPCTSAASACGTTSTSRG